MSDYSNFTSLPPEQEAQFVVYERQLDNDSGAVAELARQGYVGISSAFGTALYGRAATAYTLAGEVPTREGDGLQASGKALAA